MSEDLLLNVRVSAHNAVLCLSLTLKEQGQIVFYFSSFLTGLLIVLLSFEHDNDFLFYQKLLLPLSLLGILVLGGDKN